MSRQLDRHRPLWEMYFIEGLEGGRFAILSKSHQILVDGVATIDLGQVILDVDPQPKRDRARRLAPAARAEPAGAGRRTRSATRCATRGRRSTTLAGNAGSVVAHGRRRRRPGRRGRRRAVQPAVTPGVADQRDAVRAAPVRHRARRRCEDYRTVRRFHGGTVNDVILATITGAMRNWLMTRAESVHGSRSLRALVPMSVIDSELEPTSLGSQVAGHLLSLPIGESSPVVRLHQVSYALKAHKETGRAVAADRLAGVAGFAPTTFHALGSRVAATQLAARLRPRGHQRARARSSRSTPPAPR